MRKIWLPVLGILLCEAVGFLATPATLAAIPQWYNFLKKPVFAPPNWVFGPVWTLLYALMGIAAAIIWQKGMKKKSVRSAILWFGIQLFLNFMWSELFFGLRSPLYGFIGIIFLWIAIVVSVVKFSRISQKAAVLMIPYIAWVSFAGLLNLSLLLLNR